MTMPMTPQQIQQLFSGKPEFGAAVTHGEVHLKRYNSDPPRYEIYWPQVGGDVPVGLDNVDMLFSPTRTRKAIFEMWKIVIEKIEAKDWPNLITILNASVEEIDAPGASPSASVLDALERWCGTASIGLTSVSDLYYRPVYIDGFYYFRIDAFYSYALYGQHSPYFYQRQDMSRPKLHKILGRAGGKSIAKTFQQQSVRVWQIPEDFNKPTEPAQGELSPDDDEEEGDSPDGERGDIPNDF